MESPWLYAIVAGLAVLAATSVARRVRGPLAGVMAAAPVTPTVSFLLLGGGQGAKGILLQGLPAVVLAAAGVLVVILARDPRTRPAAPGVIALVVLGAPLATLTVTLAAGLAIAACASVIGLRATTRPTRSRAAMPAWARFSVGAGAILLVAAAQAAWPASAGWLALAPWLFVASAVAAGLDRGPDAAVRVLHGGVGGAVGVMAFVLVVAGSGQSGSVSLALGWAAFAGTALAWQPLCGAFLRTPRRRLPPAPAPPGTPL